MFGFGRRREEKRQRQERIRRENSLGPDETYNARQGKCPYLEETGFIIKYGCRVVGEEPGVNYRHQACLPLTRTSPNNRVIFKKQYEGCSHYQRRNRGW